MTISTRVKPGRLCSARGRHRSGLDWRKGDNIIVSISRTYADSPRRGELARQIACFAAPVPLLLKAAYDPDAFAPQRTARSDPQSGQCRADAGHGHFHRGPLQRLDQGNGREVSEGGT